MNPKLDKFLYLAEEQYLQSPEIEDYKKFLVELAEKVYVYEVMRDKEEFLFNILADELQEAYPDERSQVLGEALTQWSIVLRYCCMAMILDNPEYLSLRLDNWVRDNIELRSSPAMDKLLYETLIEILPEVLIDEQCALLMPYLDQVQSLAGLEAKEETLLGAA